MTQEIAISLFREQIPILLYIYAYLHKLSFIRQFVRRAVGNTCYTLQVLSIGQKTDGNPHLEFAWQSLSEIPVNFISAFLADRLGRRYTGVLSFSITSVAWSLIALRETSKISIKFS